jgi:uncharacterized protein (DUF2252 family)
MKSLDTINPALQERRASPQARREAGRSRRNSVPLEAHAEVVANSEHREPLTILAQQDATRLAELIPIRYGRMSRTPFTFLRGAAAIMANDLAAGPSTDLQVELCGDAHLGNFRLYLSPDRQLVFDLNDFDETLPGPFEWDVKRLAASITVAARSNDFSKGQARAATRHAMQRYRESIGEASRLNPLDLYYYRFDSEAVTERIRAFGKKHRQKAENTLKKAIRKNSLKALGKYTDIVDGRRVIVPDPPLVVPVEEHLAVGAPNGISALFERYRETLPQDRRLLTDRFTPVDVARTVVGVGSVGTRCLILYLEAGDGTPLFLQFKQAVSSVLEPYLGASRYEHAGQRVVEGQRLIQATSDVFLGWARYEQEEGANIDFYFRQLWDGKGKLNVEMMAPKGLKAFAGLCAEALAFAHARSGDAMTIHGYIDCDEMFDDAMVDFADRYADLTEADHAELVGAINDGAIDVIHDI